MTQQEINQRNEQIALMLGYKRHKLERNWFWEEKRMTYYRDNGKPVGIFTNRWYIEHFRFHSDWNELMYAAKFLLKSAYADSEPGIWYAFADAIPNMRKAFIVISEFAKSYNAYYDTRTKEDFEADDKGMYGDYGENISEPY